MKKKGEDSWDALSDDYEEEEKHGFPLMYWPELGEILGCGHPHDGEDPLWCKRCRDWLMDFKKSHN